MFVSNKQTTRSSASQKRGVFKRRDTNQQSRDFVDDVAEPENADIGNILFVDISFPYKSFYRNI